jgi:hypothetical protein
LPIPTNIEVLSPWQTIQDSPDGNKKVEFLSEHLFAEVPPGHVLYGLKTRAVAYRLDRDDILFEVEGSEMPLAVVHMTWQKETDPRWPNTQFFGSWEQWVKDEMLPAHEEHELS